MKILKIKLPDDVKERRIFVMAGSEILAIREPGMDRFQHKTTRCNMCGLCCLMETDEKGFGIQEMQIGGKVQNICGAVKKDGDKYECHAGPTCHWGCIAECTMLKSHPDCIIEYEK